MSGSSGISVPQKQPHAATKASSPTRARHQIQRSITEITSPARLGRHHYQHHTHTSHHNSSQSSSRHKRRSSRDDRNMNIPQSAAPILQNPPRGSLEVPRSERVSPRNLSPAPSPRGSVYFIPPRSEDAGEPASLAPAESRDEALRREKERAEARTTGLKKSFVDLATFSTSTTRRLDEAYYNVLEKLASLQKTIVALKDLATEASADDGLAAESQSVLSETQAQLDAFGQFDEQEGRVQALQDRVHGGRGRIEALSARVDVVRHKVERWERADREWQEKTRRRLKMVWGVVLGLALALLVLYVGAMAYGPGVEGVARELKEDAMLARLKLESGEGSQAPFEAPSATPGGEQSVTLDFSRGGSVDALRVLDEL